MRPKLSEVSPLAAHLHAGQIEKRACHRIRQSKPTLAWLDEVHAAL